MLKNGYRPVTFLIIVFFSEINKNALYLVCDGTVNHRFSLCAKCQRKCNLTLSYINLVYRLGKLYSRLTQFSVCGFSMKFMKKKNINSSQ